MSYTNGFSPTWGLGDESSPCKPSQKLYSKNKLIVGMTMTALLSSLLQAIVKVQLHGDDLAKP